MTVRSKMQRKIVRRLPGQCFNISNIFPSFKYGYIGISVWAAFSTRGLSPLALIDWTLNREKCQAILKAHVVPFSIQHYGSTENTVYQQDNCGLHQDMFIGAYIEAKRINLMKWSSQSPDYDPIKNEWAILKKRLHARPTYPTNTANLFNILRSQ